MVLTAGIFTACENDQGLIDQTEEPDLDQEDDACITVDPASIPFDNLEVGVDGPQTETVTVTNSCNGDLEIHALELDDDSAPFELGAIGAILIPKDASTTFTVTFDPQTAFSWAHQALIDSNDPETPTASVDLLGVGIAPVIALDPPQYDFGQMPLGCEKTQPITISNVGTADLIVDSLELTSASTEFELISDLEFPLTLAPGDSEEVEIRFRGIDDFDVPAYVTAVSNDPFSPQVTADFTADATDVFDGDEHYEQPVVPSTDILFVVDNSCSMSEEQAFLTDNFSSFISELENADSAFQVGVITTDNAELRGDVIDSGTADPIGEFQLQAGTAGTNGSASERGLQASWWATRSLVECDTAHAGLTPYGGGAPDACGEAGPDSSFLRDNSMLSIVILTDEADYSTQWASNYDQTWGYDTWDASAPNPRPTPFDFDASEYVADFLETKGGNPDHASFNAIAGDYPSGCNGTGGSASTPTGYYDAIQATGGTLVSICSENWGESLEDVANASIGITDTFLLQNEPVPETIQVRVDDVLLPPGEGANTHWTWNEAVNAIEFANDFVPAGGSTIDIHYQIMPTCDN